MPDADVPLTHSPRSPLHGSRLKHVELRSSYDAIIVGSGISGLSSAVFLAKQGRRVLVLERHYTAGGLTHTFRRRGFEWDTGLHYVGRVHNPDDPVRHCFDYITDARLQWQRLDSVIDRIKLPGLDFDFVSGAKNLRRNFHNTFPNERIAIDRYFDILDGFSAHVRRFAMMKAVPPLISRLAGPLFARHFHAFARRTTSEVLDEFVDNPRLKSLIVSRYGNYGLPPVRSSFAAHATVECHYLEGASYPIGGSTAIAREVVQVIEENGGQVVVQAPVAKILTGNGKAQGVLLANGREILAPVVVSSIGAVNTYTRLLGHEDKLQPVRERLKRLEPSIGHMALYLGLEGSPESLGLKRSNLWIHSDTDLDASIAAQSANANAPFPIVFVGSPKSQGHDSSGLEKTTLELIAPMPYDHFSKWKDTPWKHRGVEYNQLKSNIGERMMETVRQHLPQVVDRIRVSEVSSPLSTVEFSGHSRGQIYGVAGVPARYSEHALRPHTPISGVFLTGQDALVPGVSGAMMAGMLTSIAICKRNLLSKVTKSASKRPR